MKKKESRNLSSFFFPLWIIINCQNLHKTFLMFLWIILIFNFQRLPSFKHFKGQLFKKMELNLQNSFKVHILQILSSHNPSSSHSFIKVQPCHFVDTQAVLLFRISEIFRIFLTHLWHRKQIWIQIQICFFFLFAVISIIILLDISSWRQRVEEDSFPYILHTKKMFSRSHFITHKKLS